MGQRIATASHALGRSYRRLAASGPIRAMLLLAALSTVPGLVSAASVVPYGARLDTSRPFASDAVEQEAYLRHPPGWSVFQEGMAGGLHYRFDPDGYARFSKDLRFGPDGWEVTCTDWPQAACLGRRGSVQLRLSPDGERRLEVVDVLPGETFKREDSAGSLGAFWPAAELPPTLLSARALVSTRTGERLPVDGAEIVATYMAWVQSGQAEWARYTPPPDLPARLSAAEPPALPLARAARTVPKRMMAQPVLPILEPNAAAGSCPMPSKASLVRPAMSLRGLPGVLLVTNYMAEPTALKGRLRDAVRKAAEQRFNDANIRLLSAEEVKRTPGQPRLELYLTIGDAEHACPSRVWLSLRQEVVLARDATVHLITGTWGDGGVVPAGPDEPELAAFTHYLDRFVDAYEQANAPDALHDWAVADAALLARKRQHRKPVVAPPSQTWPERLIGSLGISVAFTSGLRDSRNNLSGDNGGAGQNSAPPTSPTVSTTLSVSPWSALYGRLTLYHYLFPSRQADYNPDFAYAFGYDSPDEGSFSLGYSNYGANRFNPGKGQSHTRFNQGSIRLAYKARFLDRLIAPRFTDEEIKLNCEPALTTTPTYFDEESGSLHNFKTALSFGCRYPIWRRLYLGATAFFYPVKDQQQDWDPDYIYSFGWANWNQGTFSLDYANYSGNRWPWRERPGGSGRFVDGSLTLSYRLPLNWLLGLGSSP